jgi:thiol:disulfide interchange protein
MWRLLAVMATFLAFAPIHAAAQTSTLSTLYANDRYDPRANPYRDLERAIDRASAENKRVLIVVGGDWCVWCDILDRFLIANADVRDAFEQTFVMLKVNWSRENENVAFLSGFPESEGYPDFLVLDNNGRFLGQQRTDVLENGRDYDRARMLAFARRWRAD